jgi:formylglycine-generating enzyme
MNLSISQSQMPSVVRVRLRISLLLIACCFLAPTGALHAYVTFDWAIVGNSGNDPDSTGFGAVSNVFRISKYEVTNAQYTEFLNAVDPVGTNPHSVYSRSMGSNARGGIAFNGGATSGSKYSTKTYMGNKPVNYVSFLDAMRFTNWLENGQPVGGVGTESEVYTISNGLNATRSPSATFFIPSEDEWYKAAYHKNDGVTGNYWDYPTSTDAVPYSDQPPGSDAPTPSNTANFYRDDGIANGYNDGYAVTELQTFNSSQNYLTDVGAYTASLGPYGTFDMGGNVYEWNEAVINSTSRCVRGGDWFNTSDLMAASYRFNANSTFEYSNVGFRVAGSAVVPEPGSMLLGALGMISLFKQSRQARRGISRAGLVTTN